MNRITVTKLALVWPTQQPISGIKMDASTITPKNHGSIGTNYTKKSVHVSILYITHCQLFQLNMTITFDNNPIGYGLIIGYTIHPPTPPPFAALKGQCPVKCPGVSKDGYYGYGSCHPGTYNVGPPRQLSWNVTPITTVDHTYSYS